MKNQFATSTLTAICKDLENGNVPDWIELLPAVDAQGRIVGRDGRWWRMSDPQAVVDEFGSDASKRRPVFGDYEHASEWTMGEPAPASAWVKELEVRDGAVWGRVEWTDKARDMIQAKEYRYISPVFTYHADTMEIIAIKSFGLTNEPNLEMTALNKYLTDDKYDQPNLGGQRNMKAVCVALGLSLDASEESIVDAINKLKEERQTAVNKADKPSPDKFVPKADYDTAMNRVKEAEGKLEKAEADAMAEKVEEAVNKAVTDGKIAPSSKDYYTATCKTQEDLDKFNEAFENAPQVVEGAGEEQAANKAPAGTLTPEETAVCKAMGMSKEEFLKQRDGGDE